MVARAETGSHDPRERSMSPSLGASYIPVGGPVSETVAVARTTT
jgi:hypothetical protein